ncbi:N-acetylmuramic acid 6-phosphate etherase [Cohnella faecalis]|uniref:N-acetylmuramic acid 6-phosphate etherase n=1 Tax=Cohnella faecalis TaxID=2315694 RepID=A0A398CEX9_9BACL|nr:N-acetylmuramic acid 6-phosphate etherase [Cohnella faecalis]RIE01283.1 N-acetylmuramic acid 6-phosphate etherase [Cohnella faecalis]
MFHILDSLTTERQNEATRNIDRMSTRQMIELINGEDRLIADAVASIIPQITDAVEAIVQRLRGGGRLIYMGAGSSGRLGILDASECPPTYGTDPQTVQGIIAGGDIAIKSAVEGAEDNDELGMEDIRNLQITSADIVVGISASGRTPYVIGAMKEASTIGAAVIGISNNRGCPMGNYADYMLECDVGPEVVLGSTRMKAGTAQKMILNMLTTASMIRLGKVYDNIMVDLTPSNEKLVWRAKRTIQMATGVSDEKAEQAFEDSHRHVKKAIVMLLADVTCEEAGQLLERAEGNVRTAIESKEIQI